MKRRVDISLGEAEVEALNRAQVRTGLSRSELVRRAVRELYGNVGAARESTIEEKRAAFARSAGAWSNRSDSEGCDLSPGSVRA